MQKQSAGILLFRKNAKEIEVMLIHPGGPFWKKKDNGAWSIPKGEFDENEDALDAARRELKEETGFDANGNFIALDVIKQKGGKLVYAWALEKDVDASTFKSNFFEIEWPPGSGRKQKFPEADQAAWFTLTEASQKINPAQVALLDQLRILHQRDK